MQDPISYAKQYLEDLLTFFGLNIDVKATCDEDEEIIELSIPSTHLNGFLIGQRGETLRSIQFLVGSALKNNDHKITRVNIDVADYKQHRNERLARKVEKWAEDVKSSEEEMRLRPMNSADRRIVHRTISDIGGVTTESMGEGRERHIVIKPELLPEGNDK
ncbi:KH domain-containing protein [Candidatus Saccharibacteria bacterium CPR2]|nr:KH domain-containing protein [Candidatus Saccharibacteria bacterium CPR2]